jgi:hypothetical protein
MENWSPFAAIAAKSGGQRQFPGARLEASGRRSWGATIAIGIRVCTTDSGVEPPRRKTLPRLPPRCPSCQESRGAQLDQVPSKGKLTLHWRCRRCGAFWPTSATPRAER